MFDAEEKGRPVSSWSLNMGEFVRGFGCPVRRRLNVGFFSLNRTVFKGSFAALLLEFKGGVEGKRKCHFF